MVETHRGQDAPAQTDRDWMAIVALVTGIVGVGPLALVLGVLGVRAANQGRNRYRGMAVAGVVLGAVWTLAGIVATAALVATVLGAQKIVADALGDRVTPPASSGVPAPGATIDPTKLRLVPIEPPDRALLDPAAAFLRTRVGAGATVNVQGDEIVVDFGDDTPGTAERALLTTAGAVQFRPVLGIDMPAPTGGGPGLPAGQKAAQAESLWEGDGNFYLVEELLQEFASLDCVAPVRGPQPAADEAVAVCAADGTAKYILGPMALGHPDKGGVRSAAVNDSAVTITFDTEGMRRFDDLSTRLAAQSSAVFAGASEPWEHGMLAIVVDDVVVSAATVATPIADGRVELSDPDLALAGALVYGSEALRFKLEASS
ncbi:DUF4190 domain-containing protein [Flavimobilis sp. GY10621]|uniref:DUF4190 domain-containing protein n=2 Tax=Flavimobilis rhizosphaerae TaxID=2775421 RepID=A0ABR9DPT9_9MICO|nr:DUF4190 domain-containing protein [Flavimobilis rhizosphaerae]